MCCTWEMPLEATQLSPTLSMNSSAAFTRCPPSLGSHFWHLLYHSTQPHMEEKIMHCYPVQDCCTCTSSRGHCARLNMQLSSPFQLLASPHLYFMHFSALSLLRRLVMVWEWHWEQDAQKSLTFIILLFQTASKKQLYGRLLSKLRKCQTCQCSQVLFLLVRTCLHVTIDCQQHGMWSTGHCGMKHLTWPSRCSQKRKPNNLGQGKSEKWINGKRR